MKNIRKELYSKLESELKSVVHYKLYDEFDRKLWSELYREINSMIDE